MTRSTALACGAVGLLFAAVAVWSFGASWLLVPYLGLAAVSAVLGYVDLTTKRLPNRIVLPALAASMVLLLLVSLAEGRLANWVGALLGGVALFALYLVLALIAPGGLGMGDVKLAALVGLFAGYLGWSAWVLSALAGFVVGALVGLALLLLRRAQRGTLLPFGPWMLVGLWVAIALAG